jgi:hypothetical protein
MVAAYAVVEDRVLSVRMTRDRGLGRAGRHTCHWQPEHATGPAQDARKSGLRLGKLQQDQG